jgi:uncharacterized delta-60 repeat protein
MRKLGFTLLFLTNLTGWTHAQYLFIDSSFGVNGFMRLASPDSLNISSPVFDFKSNRIKAVHNAYLPQSSLNIQPGMILFNASGTTIDSGFNTDGRAQFDTGPLVPSTTNGNSAFDIMSLPDGRTLLAGRKRMPPVNITYWSLVTAVLPTGEIDTNFGSQGYVTHNNLNYNSRANDLYYQSDKNRILVYSNSNVNVNNHILALTLQGKLDSTYGLQGKAYWTDSVFANKLGISAKPLYDAHGRTYIHRAAYSSIPYIFLYDEWIRLTPDGHLDSTFGMNGFKKIDSTFPAHTSNHYPSDFNTNTIDAAGHCYIFMYLKSNDQQVVVKFKPDGSVDSTFAVNGIFTVPTQPTNTYYNHQQFFCSQVLPNGTLLLGGDSYDTMSNNKVDHAILKLTAQGLLDTSFGLQGIYYQDHNNFNQDGIREIQMKDSSDIYFCGTAHKSALNSAQYYTVLKMKYSAYPLSVANQDNPFRASLFPNPVSQKLNLLSDTRITKTIVSDLWGNQFPITLRNQQISVEHLPNGIYHLQLWNVNNEHTTLRFTVYRE